MGPWLAFCSLWIIQHCIDKLLIRVLAPEAPAQLRTTLLVSGLSLKASPLHRLPPLQLPKHMKGLHPYKLNLLNSWGSKVENLMTRWFIEVLLEGCISRRLRKGRTLLTPGILEYRLSLPQTSLHLLWLSSHQGSPHQFPFPCSLCHNLGLPQSLPTSYTSISLDTR